MDLALPGLFTKCTANGAEVWLSFKSFCQFCERFLERLEGDQICIREHCPDTLSKLSNVGTHVQHCLDAAVCEPMILGLVLRAKSRNHFEFFRRNDRLRLRRTPPHKIHSQCSERCLEEPLGSSFNVHDTKFESMSYVNAFQSLNEFGEAV